MGEIMNNDYEKNQFSGLTSDLQSETSPHKEQLRAQLALNFKDRKTTRTRFVAVALAAFIILLSTGQSTDVGSGSFSLTDGKPHEGGFQVFKKDFSKTHYSNSGMKDETRDQYRTKLELVDEATAAKDYKVNGVTGWKIYGHTMFIEEREYLINDEILVFHTGVGPFKPGKKEVMVIIDKSEAFLDAIDNGLIGEEPRETHVISGVPFSFKVWKTHYEKYGEIVFYKARKSWDK